MNKLLTRAHEIEFSTQEQTEEERLASLEQDYFVFHVQNQLEKHPRHWKSAEEKLLPVLIQRFKKQ